MELQFRLIYRVNLKYVKITLQTSLLHGMHKYDLSRLEVAGYASSVH